MSFWKNVAQVIVQRHTGQPMSSGLPSSRTLRKGGGFASFLKGLPQNQANNLVAPVPPTVPNRTLTPEEQQRYNVAIADYNRKTQAYQSHLLSLLVQRFSLMQMTLAQNNRAAASTPATLPTNSSLGIGSIIGTDT